MTGLLDGMRVLDFGLWRPTGHATAILCALGAEVLMVEPPGGAPMRAYPQIFAGIAHGKRSVELDLRSDAGRVRALGLVDDTDVVVEGWRPGVAERLGLGEPALRARKPSVISCSISGYGQTGPWRDVPGHDLTFQAVAGAVAPQPTTPEPQIPRLPVADLESGTLAATLVCAAWARRASTGEGEHIDLAMADVVSWWVGAESRTRVEGIDMPMNGAPGYGVFETADGKWLALAPLGEPKLWRAICSALELTDLAPTPFEELVSECAAVNDRVGRAVASLSFADAMRRLSDAGAPVAPVLTPEEAVRHPQLSARGIVGEAQVVGAQHETVVAVPAHLAHHPPRDIGTVPAPGEHTGFASAD